MSENIMPRYPYPWDEKYPSEINWKALAVLCLIGLAAKIFVKD